MEMILLLVALINLPFALVRTWCTWKTYKIKKREEERDEVERALLRAYTMSHESRDMDRVPEED